MITTTTFAQTYYDGSVPKVSFIPPDAAALFKTVERPVGTFSGTTSIDIPIYTFSSGGVQLPISISYATGGIKVEEVASMVGLGWALNTGGNISRVMNGISDDIAGGYLHMASKPSNFPAGWPTSTTYLTYADMITKGQMDIEPDLFYVNCNGVTGKFYFDESGNVVMCDRAPIKIEIVWKDAGDLVEHIGGWIVTDDKGYKYYFGMDKMHSNDATESTQLAYTSDGPSTGNPNSSSYIASWRLLEVRSMNDELLLSFHYSTVADGANITTKGSASTVLSQQSGVIECPPGQRYSYVYSVTTYSSQKRLLYIADKNDTLFLFSNNNRVDCPGNTRVDSMVLKDNRGECRKRVHFNYDYFSIPSAPSGIDNDALYKRLKLKNVSFWGRYNPDSLLYNFSYIEDVNLPSRLSNAVDYWGYYNGKSDNQSPLPNGTYETGLDLVTFSSFGDKRADFNYGRANALTKVTYPTGGYRELDYEGNQSLFEYGSQLMTDRASTQLGVINVDANAFSQAAGPITRYETSFTVNSYNPNTTFQYDLVGELAGGAYTVRIFTEAGAEIYSMSYQSISSSASVTLSNGNYLLQIEYDQFCHFYNLSAYWEEVKINTLPVLTLNGSTFYATNTNVGGLRLKQVTDFDPVSNKSYSTQYRYQLPQDNTLTSGLQITAVKLAARATCSNNSCVIWRLTSQSCYPLASTGGSYVMYPYVRTIENGNGYTDRVFSFERDENPNFSYDPDFPIVPKVDNSWKRGKLLSEKVYNNSNVLLQKKVYMYPGLGNTEWEGDFVQIDTEGSSTPTSFLLQSQTGVKIVTTYGNCAIGSNNPDMACTACWNPYTLNAQFCPLLGSQEIIYSGTDKIVHKTIYSYYVDMDQPLLKRKVEYVSEGDTKETIVRYAFNNASDFHWPVNANDQAMQTALLAKNYLQPLEVQESVTHNNNKTVAHGSAFSFSLFNNKIEMSSYREYSSNTDYQEQVFTEYDAYENLLAFHKKDDINQAYIWGYNHALPTAKVTNASAGEVFFSGFEEADWQNGTSVQFTTDAHTGKQACNIAAGNLLWPAVLSAGIYKVSYWLKGGGEINFANANILAQKKKLVRDNWYLCELTVQFTTPSQVNIYGQAAGGTQIIDDLRIYPANAFITTYTYDTVNGITSETDVNHKTRYYEYDSFGRLSAIRDNEGNIIKKLSYKYLSN